MDQKLKVIDEFQVAPPSGSLPATISQPLNMLDLPLLTNIGHITMKGIFFYAYPQSIDHFTQKTIPSLKSSLSLTLQYFYPFVSKLVLPPAPQKPYVLFTEGDSVSFTVFEYTGGDNDFDYFISKKSKEVKELHYFAPNLPGPTCVSPDGTQVDTLFTVRITLFPNQGFCIGLGSKHSVADGRATHHFVKSWASLCKSNCDVELAKIQMPSFNTDSIEDPNGIESKLLKKWHGECNSSFEGRETDDELIPNKVRSTFVMRRIHVEKLKQFVTDINNTKETVRLSSFVVTCSFIWQCFIKSLESSSDDEVCLLYVPVEFRNRIKGLTATYFGNGISGFFAGVKRSELVAHDGILVAARAIQTHIKELGDEGAMRTLEKWSTPVDQKEFGSAPLLFVLGSPKFDFYDKDFGWGILKKGEILHIGSQDAISLSEYKGEEGGIEIAIELKRAEMETFTQLFHQSLDMLLNY